MVVRSVRNIEVDREILAIDDLGVVTGGGKVLSFLRAETSAKYRTPFVLVRYAINGIEQKEGLRLDLDKRAFLDHLEDPSLEASVANFAVAEQIAELVGDFLNHRDSNDGRNPLPKKK